MCRRFIGKQFLNKFEQSLSDNRSYFCYLLRCLLLLNNDFNYVVIENWQMQRFIEYRHFQTNNMLFQYIRVFNIHWEVHAITFTSKLEINNWLLIDY